MTAAFSPRLDDSGTAEHRWRQWPVLAELPTWEPRPPARVVVVSPHPDDDVLGAGGTLRHLARAGAELIAVAVTAGEASHPTSVTMAAPELAVRRDAEADCAYRRLGLAPSRVRLRLPDGAVEARRDQLVDQLRALLRPGDWCLAPWEGDGHPDHNATGRAAQLACAVAGARPVSYLVWAWHWAGPGDARVPWRRARRVTLLPSDRRRKRRAVGAFRSQIERLSLAAGDEAVLSDGELAHHLRPFEVLLL